ncbi:MULTISPECIES: HAD family hydrolase [Petrimonas]|jgi:phosphoglycolate phosphatase-like HAD superfamily hydrolase|uniref:HAD family hydrolase n=1 Tax=Petrimonas TaxID=307628 RepID=UPI0008E686DE|nr:MULTISPECIES: HAD family hydrolase [Petrimonas]MDD3560388.1 HAD family hydrolase [Petrimonas mucosa]SFU28707.1 Phosphoglycolate phosphatase, HAD superfamily [Porphyromonadaceae bacterium KHP3R9]HHT28745.1 HAD family hydrolase [Petrimonas mucosa]
MRYRHIVFDIDGTMLDTGRADMLATQETFFQLTGEWRAPEEFRFALGIPNSTVFARLGIEDVEEASLMWEENFSKYHPTIRLFDGIVEILKALRELGIYPGIVTSRRRREFNADFAAFGLNHLFGTVICVDDTPRPKPYPDPLLEYLKRVDGVRQETIYIGDTLYDEQCAHAAGVDFALAAWGAHSREGIRADHHLESPGEVLKLVVDDL